MILASINLPTPNARKLADFYHKVLGANVDDSHGGPNRIEIWFGDRDEKPVGIVANQDESYKRQETDTCQGFEFSVQDADAEYARMLDLGVEIEKLPQDLPWGYRYFHIKDPDGNGIDIVQELSVTIK